MTPAGVFHGHAENIQYLEFSADGKKLLTTSDDLTVRLWEVATQKQLGFIKSDLDVKKYTDLSIVEEAAKRLK